MTRPAPATASRTRGHDLATELRIVTLRMARRIRSEAATGALSEGQHCALATLARRGALTPRELAQVENVRPPTMTRTITALEHAGLVERAAHPSDGRQVLLSPTDEGRGVLRDTAKRRSAWVSRRLRGLSVSERATLKEAAAIMRRLVEQ